MQRDDSIDYLKGILVIGMVYTHVLQFFSHGDFFPSIFYITEFFNLITFSGFVFCFGYVCQLAYYRKSFTQVFKNMFMTGLKVLIAFYISGIAFLIFVENQPMRMETIELVILFRSIPGWSEFLISFALIILIGLLLFNVVVWISNRLIIFWTTIILLLATTFINYDLIHSTYIALFIGTIHFPTFPV